MKLLIFVGMNIGSYLGWLLGEQFGGLMTALVISGIGALAGVYGGWWVARRYLE